MKFDVRKFLVKLILSALVIGAVILLLSFVLRRFGIDISSQENIRALVLKSGALAPLIFILISFLQVTLVPIPGAITIAVGYYLFGFWQSFLYSYIGMMLGAIFAYLLGIWLGRPFAVWLAGSEETLDGWMKRLKGRENVLLFFMFLLPLFPDDLLCTVAGIIPQRPLTFIIMQLVTRTTSIGATLISTAFVLRGWPFAVLIVVLVALVIPAFILCYKHVDRISDFFIKVGKRLTGKGKNKHMTE